MKKIIARSLTRFALLAAVLGLASCTTTKPARGNYSTQFDPPAQQPSNPSAVKVKISTVAQRLYVMEGNRVLLATPCSVGKPGDATPAGMHRIQSKMANRRRQSQPGAGYPMTYWMSFYSPAYGMHWGFVKPYPSTMGCVRMPLKAAQKTFSLVRSGTPINISTSQPWDATVGKSLPRLDDSHLPDPPMSYLLSPQVFADARQGKMWRF
jgi:hypothetical protein